MIIEDQYYDVIIVGTGAGGGTLAYKLASTGKKVLLLERGDFMALEEQNRSNIDIFKKERYHAPEQWYDISGEPFSPQTNYAVGGNTKIWATALIRMRSRDFEAVDHQKGVSPEWCLKYKDFEPYYTEAEQLYRVHGAVVDDPTEPPHSSEYQHTAIAHEPQIQQMVDAIAKQGVHPTSLPLSLTRESDDPTNDSQVSSIAPALKHPNVTLKTSAKVTHLHTNPSGRAIKAVEAEIGGRSFLFLGDIVVLACGAVNSAAILLRSASDACPNGIANSSDLVGRNLMKHRLSAVVQLSSPNSGKFYRSVSVNDFYWGEPGFEFPMGHIQNTGGLLQDITFAESPPFFSGLAQAMPGFGLNQLVSRSIGWWVQTEDLPDPKNRVEVGGDKLRLFYEPNNTEAHERLVYRWTEVLKMAEKSLEQGMFQRGAPHPHGEMPMQVVANQCGTCRFGEDPTTSVLNADCCAHDVDNLYVVDSSFFPSNPAVSPALTIIANALRVGDRLIERLK
ncbi:GMC family oxidoreductase [Phormidium sp. CLA17]|uniref:GMC oxidoreductase n=1 Tax=Leptolyngbya sp. Cla-17 TaxID=2803751 RepID=UPI0014916D6F|nr:GMC family oxidoreductase [Leptolyngbya sp. Cla-17]MBM0742485.1 GMC family oxidoreductase [Leptolyngbya sp. Cla-17]